MKELSEKSKKLIFGLIIALLILMFCGGIFLGIRNVLLTEGTMELPPLPPVYISGEPADAEEGVALFTTLLGEAAQKSAQNRVKLSVSTDISADDDSISNTNGDGALNDVLKYMNDDLTSQAEELSCSFATGFGEDFTGKIIPVSFSAADVAAFESAANEGNPSERYLKFVFADAPLSEAGVLADNFHLKNTDGVFAAMKEKGADVFTVTGSEILCSGFEIFARYNAETDELLCVEYKRNYKITLSVSFSGELAELRENTVSFDLCGKEKYEFTYAGLRLSDTVMWLEKGETDNLQAFRTADEDVTVTWTSSDESTAQVDDEGYIKGVAESAQPVIITASFDYSGCTYSQTCTVYVRTPVEEVKHAEREHEMNVGDTYTPDTLFKPEKAEIRTLYWFTEDAAIASVDASGVITAVAPGTVNVYSISLDGNYKASVAITVKGGEING